jgi:NAD(P)-dependent dehydrogenase (short-subunit alcohol dehydrogenase family)
VSRDGASGPIGSLTGKTAFVAGASSGINLAIAQNLAELGVRTTIISRRQDRIAAAADSIVAAGGECIGLAADVRDAEAVRRAYEHAATAHGPVDIVISGAAGNFLAAAVDLSPNAFKTVVDIDLIGTYNVLHTSWDFITKPGASLISITAPQAVRPTPQQAHACAAKAGVNMLTKVLAMEWGPSGVRVNAISPGFIADTEGTKRLTAGGGMERLMATVPLRRLGHTSDIASLAVYLCQEDGAFINGAIIDCDGGYALGASGDDVLVAPRASELAGSTQPST